MSRALTRGRWAVTIFTVTLLLHTERSRAEDIEVVHLETADDAGLNWAFWTCSKSGARELIATRKVEGWRVKELLRRGIFR